jgi:hypothetical protein
VGDLIIDTEGGIHDEAQLFGVAMLQTVNRHAERLFGHI